MRGAEEEPPADDGGPADRDGLEPVGDVDDPGHPGPLLRHLHAVDDAVLGVDPADADAASEAVPPPPDGGATEATATGIVQHAAQKKTRTQLVKSVL